MKTIALPSRQVVTRGLPSDRSVSEPLISLVGLSVAELREAIARWGEPPYRANQIARWLYREHVFDPREMRDLPSRLRERLVAELAPFPLEPVVEHSADRGLTTKALLRLANGSL